MSDNKLAGGDVGCERHNVQNCRMCASDQAAVTATLQTVARGTMNDTARAALRQAVMEARVRFRQARARLKELERNTKEAREIVVRYTREIAELQHAAGDPIEIDPAIGIIGNDDVV